MEPNPSIGTSNKEFCVLSPILFNLYLRDMPELPEGIKVISYADNSYVQIVSDWLEGRLLGTHGHGKILLTIVIGGIPLPTIVRYPVYVQQAHEDHQGKEQCLENHSMQQVLGI